MGSDKGGGTSLVVLSFLSKGFIWVESLLLFGSLVGHGTEVLGFGYAKGWAEMWK